MSIPQSKEDLKSSLHHHSTANPTPTHTTSKHTPLPPPTSTSSYITFPMTYAVSGILRRLSSDTHNTKSSSRSSSKSNAKNMEHFAPPYRKPSPFQPPPLTPLLLSGWSSGTKENARLLTRALAEEIRLLVPARLQLEENWRLIFSLEQNGTSLATLFEKSEDYRGKRGGYVLVIRDGLGGIFGAYLSDPPHPSSHYYGTGECFLWRSAILPAMLDLDLSQLPPPPSADTTHAQRQTTLLAPKLHNGVSGTSTPERIRFKAFPYSGVNDYMMYCEHGYISVGAGDGHYGLWIDDNLDKGVSSTCSTFGNEPLSDEGKKFEVMGLELWYMGA